MNARKLEKFKKLLTKEKDRVETKVEIKKREEIQISPDDLMDETDLAVTEINQSLQLRLRDREQKMLGKIEAALRRIDQGTFGDCLDCEEPIEPKRLEARPISTLCLNCKEVQEHREKIYA